MKRWACAVQRRKSGAIAFGASTVPPRWRHWLLFRAAAVASASGSCDLVLVVNEHNRKTTPSESTLCCYLPHCAAAAFMSAAWRQRDCLFMRGPLLTGLVSAEKIDIQLIFWNLKKNSQYLLRIYHNLYCCLDTNSINKCCYHELKKSWRPGNSQELRT